MATRLAATRRRPAVGQRSRGWAARAWGSGDLPSLHYPVKLGVVVAAYSAAAGVGYAFHFTGPIAAIVWLPVGVGIASLYLLGLGVWPAVLVGDLVVNNYTALPVSSAVGQSLGNLAEVTLAAWLLRGFARRHPPLATISGFERMLVAITAGTIVSATVGTAALYLGHVIDAGSIVHLWRTWWLGDFCGAVIVVPLAIAWLPAPARPWFRGHLLEVMLMLATLVVVSTIAVQVDRTLSYLAFVVLIWAGLRFGVRGATLAVVVGAGFTIWGTTNASGPFAFMTLDRSVVDTQLYLAVAAIASLSVATLARERERLAQRVSESRMRVVVAADTERRRLERDLHDGAQQRLTALSAHLGMASRRVDTAPASAAVALRAAQEELEAAIDELRDLVHGIHPTVLRRSGLARAIEMAAARASTPIALMALPAGRFDEIAETSAYFVVLEALNNAQRHSGAHLIRVLVRQRGDRLLVDVADDGVGGATETDALGLQGLRDRVEAIGGTFAISSEPGAGTRVFAAIPAQVIPDAAAPAPADH